jgi:hypothetical protein
MTFFAQYAAKGWAPAATEGSLAELIEDWPNLPALPPLLSTWNRAAMTKRDRLAGASNERVRPHPNYGTFATFDGAVHRCLNQIFANFVGTLDPKVSASAVEFNAFSDSDLSLRKTNADGTVTYATFRLLEVGGCEFFNIWRIAGSGTHSDVIWLKGGPSKAQALNFWFHDCFLHNTLGSCQRILAEAGSYYGVGLLERFITGACVRNRGTIKGDGQSLWIVESPNLELDISGAWEAVVISRSPGVKIGSSTGRTTRIINVGDASVNVPRFSATGWLVDGTGILPGSAPPPPVDIHADCKLQLAAAQKARMEAEEALSRVQASHDALQLKWAASKGLSQAAKQAVGALVESLSG